MNNHYWQFVDRCEPPWTYETRDYCRTWKMGYVCKNCGCETPISIRKPVVIPGIPCDEGAVVPHDPGESCEEYTVRKVLE